MPILQTMSAVQLVGHGGPEQLVYSDDVPVPLPADGEVLIDVHACGMNNTDVWVREGAYGSDTDPKRSPPGGVVAPHSSSRASRVPTSSAASPASDQVSTRTASVSG